MTFGAVGVNGSRQPIIGFILVQAVCFLGKNILISCGFWYYRSNEAEPDGMSLLLLAGKRWSGVLSVRECDTGMKL